MKLCTQGSVAENAGCEPSNGGGIKTNLPTCFFSVKARWASTIGGHPDILQGLPSRAANARPHQCAQANGAFVCTRSNSYNTPATIRTLDKWKWRRLVPSSVGLCFGLFLLAGRQSFFMVVLQSLRSKRSFFEIVAPSLTMLPLSFR